MDELSPDTNVRHYVEGDKVHLKEGGEARILKIVYIVMTDTHSNEVELLGPTDFMHGVSSPTIVIIYTQSLGMSWVCTSGRRFRWGM